MARGDHLRVRRSGYWHHGIDCGDGTVIHYQGHPLQPRRAHVARTSIHDFARGGDYDVVARASYEDGSRVLARAASRMGERSYHVFRNNCEHFASWCSSGRSASPQVRRAMLKVAGTVAVCGVCIALTVALKKPIFPRVFL
ncbi:MAG: hypothetical protein AMXMBFR84_34360 [Candidatus Hydrogenedentota bacterium]